MAPEVIDLLSSDDVSEIPSSSAPAVLDAHSRGISFNDLNDEVDFLPSPKRRRLTPPPVLSKATELPTSGNAFVTTLKPLATEPSRPRIDHDLTILTSSPGLPVITRKPGVGLQNTKKQLSTKDAVEDLLAQSFSSDVSPRGPSTQNLGFSSRTAAILAELDGNRKPRRDAASSRNTADNSKDTTSGFAKPPARSARHARAPVSSIEESPSSPPREAAHGSVASTAASKPAMRKQKLTTPERAEKDRAKAEEKETLKAQKAAERAQARETKAREKQLAADLAEVNKARHDKKVSVAEMIVCMPAALRRGTNVKVLAEEVLRQLNVKVQIDETVAEVSKGDPNANVISWKREIRAEFDAEQGHWVPIRRMEVRDEMNHVLCVMDAKQFAAMVQRDVTTTTDNGTPVGSSPDLAQGLGLTAHVRAFKSRWPSRKPVYLIEGLEAFMRKSRSSKNRSYQAAVRAQSQTDGNDIGTATTATTAPRRKRKADATIMVDDEQVEDALLQLQVEHGCLIHHTTSGPETAEWIGNFTQHISTIPYKSQLNSGEASFCMDVGQVKTGDDKDDTFVKMLQEIVRVTLPVAYGIAMQYPSVTRMIQAMKRDGPLFCQDLKKCSNKNGAFTDARIGPAISRRIYKIFTNNDPESMDV